MEEQTRIPVRPIASPLPLTLLGLMIGSTVLSGTDLGWIPAVEQRQAGWMMLVIPIPLQLLAAWWGFVTRSAIATTGSGVLAASWLALGAAYVDQPSGHGSTAALGFFLVAAGVALWVPTLADAYNGTLLVALVLAAAGSRFVVTGVAALLHSHGWTHASGWVGLVVAFLALYTSIALELESVAQRPVLPVFRVGRARAAMEAPLEEQLRGIEHEPGVRKAL